MSISEVILVNEADEPTGAMEKMQAHKNGILHRAFSVFIFNSAGDMLLQRRSELKYHSPGLWTNACCSHPAPGEETSDAASRRLMEELGFETPLSELFSFTYRTSFDNGLTENEFDHVFAGIYDGDIEADAEEVMDYQYLALDEIASKLEFYPEEFSSWFNIAFPRIEAWAKKELNIFQKPV
ncbi:MAG: isopentenyl-diphosphate Delta-isomerase [Flavitalea sp.]